MGEHREHGRAKVYCGDCGEWVTGDAEDGSIACECGNRFVVTVTPLRERPA